MQQGKRGRRHRVRAVLAVVGAVVLGAAGCDAVGGDSPAPSGSAVKPSPSPTPVWDTSPESIAAVGDSITRGFDACTVLSDCPEVSWATGSSPEVDSVAVRLLGADAAERSWNHAVSGARMADLAAQLTQAAARKPELVTVLVGANDACRASLSAMTPVADFRTQFETAMSTLRKALPKTQVFVASIPDLKQLWSQGRTSPLGRQVWKLGVCPTMLGDADAVDTAATERRETVQQRVEDYNTVLQEVCAEDRRCRTDGGAVYDFRFGAAQLSPWDWFHPSVDGQARLAEIAHRAITAKGR
ncbi:SGNH/GDSL hydrolase family protein [Streptomyces poriticola]|uniref:SGNH/GDSL hydrolase family protein n=1 Tax=Streptomyces poriticola TaxID=3120506 RepID=UPI002FCE3C24